MSETVKTESPAEVDHKARLESIPPVLVTLRDYLQEELSPLLRTMFEKADDAFFELAEKAQMDAEQKIYLTAKKELRTKRRTIENNFLSLMREVFHLAPDAVANNKCGTEEKPTHIDDPMAKVAAVVDVVADKANTQLQSILDKVTKQINNLLPAYVLDKYNSPFSIYIALKNFVTACEILTIEPEERVIVLNMFEKYVISDFDKILNKAHLLLLEGEIASLASASKDVNPDSAASLESMVDIDPLLFKEKFSIEQTKGHAVLENKRTLLFQKLTSLQTAVLSDLSDKDVYQLAGLVKSFANELHVESDSSLGRDLQQAIDLMRMLIGFMLIENTSPDLLSWISQLYIPLLKATLIDVTVLSSEGHVARRLLNEISRTAADVKLGSSVEDDVYRRHIVKVINRITNEFDQDLSIFPEVFVDFKLVIDDERKRQSLISERMREVKNSAARSEQANTAINKAIAQILKDKQAPTEIINFLNGPWRLVLVSVWLVEGEKSSTWLDTVKIAEVLVDSVLPLKPPRFFEQLPELLHTIKTAMTNVGFTPAEIGQFFLELEPLHLQHYQAAKKRAEKRVALKPTILPVASVANPVEELPSNLIVNDAEVAPTVVVPPPIETAEQSIDVHNDEQLNINNRVPAEQCVNELKVDMWMEFYPQKGKKQRVKIAAILKPSNTFIFVDRDGKKVIEKKADELIEAIDKGVIKLVDEDSLFGRALS